MSCGWPGSQAAELDYCIPYSAGLAEEEGVRSCGVVMGTASSKEGVNRLAIRVEVSRDGEARGSWKEVKLAPP